MTDEEKQRQYAEWMQNDPVRASLGYQQLHANDAQKYEQDHLLLALKEREARCDILRSLVKTYQTMVVALFACVLILLAFVLLR